MDYYEFYFSGEDLKFINDVVGKLLDYGVEHPRREIRDSAFIKRMNCNTTYVKYKGVDYWVSVLMNEIMIREERKINGHCK